MVELDRDAFPYSVDSTLFISSLRKLIFACKLLGKA